MLRASVPCDWVACCRWPGPEPESQWPSEAGITLPDLPFGLGRDLFYWLVLFQGGRQEGREGGKGSWLARPEAGLSPWIPVC